MKLTPRSCFSWNFEVLDDNDIVAHIDISGWREKGLLTVQGAEYPVYREGLMSGEFILESAGSTLARAWKPSAFRRSFEVECGGKQYRLHAPSVFGRIFVLLGGDSEIGSIAPDGMFTRRATVSLPEELPLPVRVFIIWLAVILWKRDAEASAAASVAAVS